MDGIKDRGSKMDASTIDRPHNYLKIANPSMSSKRMSPRINSPRDYSSKNAEAPEKKEEIDTSLRNDSSEQDSSGVSPSIEARTPSPEIFARFQEAVYRNMERMMLERSGRIPVRPNERRLISKRRRKSEPSVTLRPSLRVFSGSSSKYTPLAINRVAKVEESNDGWNPLPFPTIGKDGSLVDVLENSAEDYVDQTISLPYPPYERVISGVGNPKTPMKVQSPHLLQGLEREMDGDYVEDRNAYDGAIANKNEPLNGQAIVYGPKKRPDYFRPYNCKFFGCNKTYTCSSALASHTRSHTGEKPFVCQYPNCKKSYATRSSLKSHQRLHTGEKPFECDFEGCNKKFPTSSALKYHKRVHTGEKPYICHFEGCTRRFTQSGGLKSHLRTHTGEKPHVCSFCSKRYSQAYSLKKHIHSKHEHSE